MSETALTQLAEERKHYFLTATKSPRLGKVQDIASAVIFLKSDEAEWIDGKFLIVDDDMSMR